MKSTRIVIVFSTLLALLFTKVNAQTFWVGPKVGLELTNPVYDDKSFKKRFDVNPVLDWQAGINMDYESSGIFGVHSGLMYERISSNISNKPGDASLSIKSVYHYISAPMMVRVYFGSRSNTLSFFAQAGPRVKFWVAGNGTTISPLFSELSGSFDGVSYKVRFKGLDEGDESKIGEPKLIHGKMIQPGREFIVSKPNRIQYSIDFGGGAFLNLRNNSRVIFDFRISWGHSNMGFNDSIVVEGETLTQGLNIPEINDDLEYHHNSMTFSVAYAYGYNAQAKRKGKSSSKIK